jgi:hypothetical protein
VNGGTGEAGTITGALKGNGISPATQAACSDLSNGATGCSTAITNGTFTSTIAFGGASTGVTYASNTGYYTQFGSGTGSRVCYDSYLALSNKGSSTGTLSIGGLPFTAKKAASVSISNTTGLTYTGTLQAYIVQAGQSMRVSQNVGGTLTDLTNASASNTSDFIISGCYTVN